MATKLGSIQKRLTYTWLTFAAVMLVFNIFAAGFDDTASKAGWAWYSTAILPTTGLIMGMWVSILNEAEPSIETVNSTSSVIAQGTMAFYICTILLTLVVSCGLEVNPVEDFYTSSQHWLGYIQAPMLAFVGIIFAHKGPITESVT